MGLSQRDPAVQQKIEGLDSHRIFKAVVAPATGLLANRSCRCPPEGLLGSGNKIPVLVVGLSNFPNGCFFTVS